MSDGSPSIPPWVTAGGPPPAFITAHASGQVPWGSGGPPSSILSQMTAMNSAVSASMTGMPTGTFLPSGFSGPPAGVTGPPAGFFIPPGATGIPAGFTGIPAGATGPPTGVPLAMPEGTHSIAFTPHQAQIMTGTTSMFLALCFLAVSARLLARVLARMRFEADDWTCIAAFVFFLGMCIEQFLMGMYGERLSSPRPHSFDEVQPLLGIGLATEITYLIVTCLAKYCVLALYRRLFSLRVKWFRILWWICVAVVATYFVVTLILQMTLCTPISKHWTNPGACAFPKDRLITSGFVNAAIDLAILVLPIRTVWKLQLSTRKRIAICGVFSLGLLAVAVSIARVGIIFRREVLTESGFDFIIWSNAEPAVAIICSCLPVLRPLYTHGFAKIGSRTPWSRLSSKRSEQYGSHGTPGRSRNKDQTDTNYTGTTLKSDGDPQNTDDKKWFDATDAEIGFARSDERSATQSPVSPLDKPLPPAYTECQGDTAYHTWTWNLLSRPRDERKSPTLTRQTIIKETGYPWRESIHTASSSRNHVPAATSRSLTGTSDSYPLRLETHTPILDRSPNASSSQQPWSAGNTSTNASPTPSSFSRPLSKRSSLSMRPLPLNSSQQPARPKPVAREDRVGPRSTSAPKLAVRSQPSSPPVTHHTTFSDTINSATIIDVFSDPPADNPGDYIPLTARPRRGSHVSELAVSPLASTNRRPSLSQQRSHRAVQPTTPAESATAPASSNNIPGPKFADGEESDVDRIYPTSPSRRGVRAVGERKDSLGNGQKRPAHWSPNVTSTPLASATPIASPGVRSGRGGPRDMEGRSL